MNETIESKVRADMTRGRYWVWNRHNLFDSFDDLPFAIEMAKQFGCTMIRDVKTVDEDGETVLVWGSQ